MKKDKAKTCHAWPCPRQLLPYASLMPSQHAKHTMPSSIHPKCHVCPFLSRYNHMQHALYANEACSQRSHALNIYAAMYNSRKPPRVVLNSWKHCKCLAKTATLNTMKCQTAISPTQCLSARHLCLCLCCRLLLYRCCCLYLPALLLHCCCRTILHRRVVICSAVFVDI